jgi:hypothetical protein
MRILVACSPTSSIPALLPFGQLAPPAPSPLAYELTPRRRCTPHRSLRVPPSPPPVARAPGTPTPACPTPPPPPVVVRPPGIPPLVRHTSPPPALPWLHQSHGRADASHCHQPRCQVRPPLTKLSAELPLLPEGDLTPFFFIRPHPRRELRLIRCLSVQIF